MKTLNRRQFLKNSGLVTLAGLGGVQVGFGNSLLKGNNNDNKDLLVYVFLNGGMDGLNLMPPISGNNYSQYSTVLRPSLHIPSTTSLPLNGTDEFGFHPLASGLQSLYNQDKMAIVHATGLSQANRSHFVSTALMELGLEEGGSSLGSGWLTRYFRSSLSTSEDAVIPLVIPSYENTDAALGDASALVMGSSSEFSLNQGHWAWQSSMQNIIAEIFSQPNTIEDIVAHQTLFASQIVQEIDFDSYIPGNSATYPVSFFGEQLKTIAQMYKEDSVDLEVAYIPTGGWDTHINQGTGTTGAFAELVKELSDGLNALYQDLSASHAGKFTIIVQSEFGRRAYENESNGTDHGYGNPMFIIGDNVNPGFHGSFPGLQQNELFEDDDVAVNIDYRDVVAEVLMKRMQNRFLGYIFPGYTNYTEVGVVNGSSISPVFEFEYDGLFSSGFD